jgi:hypothetical protein
MRKAILYALLFTLTNVIVCAGHLLLFRTKIPQLAWLSMTAHSIVLLFFPYHKFNFKLNEKI